MSRKLPGLIMQHNTLMVRKTVPADVRSIIGKTELLKSLETGDIKIAVKLYRCRT